MSMWKLLGIVVAVALLSSVVVPSVATAQDQPGAAPEAAAEAEGGHAKAEAAPSESVNKGLIAIATGLAIALAAFGGALGQARAAAAALEGIARNPGARGQVFVPFILALALIESLVLYALIIAFVLSGKF